MSDLAAPISRPKPAISLPALERRIVACEACPRLRGWCVRVGAEKKRAYADQTYWARPVPGFGDPDAWLWVIGLAPGAHGANRTGRVFTGDRSGDFLYSALHRAGLASQPHSVSRDDGMRLTGVYISAAVRCAPPGNKPTPAEAARCAPYLDNEWRLLKGVKTILALGKIAWDASIALARRQEATITADTRETRPAFGHGVAVTVTLPGAATRRLIGSYHVSQQNTFTGKLTPAMFDDVLRCCREKQ